MVFDHRVDGGDAGYRHGGFGVGSQRDWHGIKELESTVSQWDHVDALLTWIIIYSSDINWRTSYYGRLRSADGLCNCRARTRVCAHWILDGFAGSLVCQYQLASLTPPPPPPKASSQSLPITFFRLNHTVIMKTQRHISILYCVYG